MVKIDKNTTISFGTKDLVTLIIVVAAAVALWLDSARKISNNEEMIITNQKVAVKLEQTIEKIKNKTDDTHDAVIRISTILEHR